ncbi:MAG: universal stress protein [Nitrospira sp.]
MMTQLNQGAISNIRDIFHPTDFSPPSMAAFAHALKLTIGTRADLTIMHVDPDRADADFYEFPRVRATLARWGLLPHGATKDQLLQLGLGVRKIRAVAADPVTSLVQFLWSKPADLLVAATHERDELASWLHNPLAEQLSRRSRIMTLFVPELTKGFVALETGQSHLRRILIPVDHRPSPQLAIEAACAMVDGLKEDKTVFHLFYVGNEGNLPKVRFPVRLGWHWDWTVASGMVVDEILSTAERLDCDLMVMSTQGRHGFLDALCGNTTERVLRHSTIPLLAVPELRSLQSLNSPSFVAKRVLRTNDPVLRFSR